VALTINGDQDQAVEPAALRGILGPPRTARAGVAIVRDARRWITAAAGRVCQFYLQKRRCWEGDSGVWRVRWLSLLEKSLDTW